MIQKQFNLNPRARSNEGYSLRCYNSLNYEKRRNNYQSTILKNDEAFKFSQEFANIVHKFCPNIQMTFFDESWEEVLQTLGKTFKKILKDMKKQLRHEFTEKEEYIKKTTAKLIKYEELLNTRKKEFDEKCTAWTKYKDEENNKLQNEKEEIIILKCRLQKELEMQNEKLEQKEKKTFRIIEDFEAMHSDLMKAKIENQNITWEILQQSLKLEEKAALIAWKEKIIKEDLKSINEEKYSSNFLSLKLLNEIPKINHKKHSSNSIEKLNFNDSPSSALNSSNIGHDSFQKEETDSPKKKNSSFSSFTKFYTTESEPNIKNEIFNDFTRTIYRQEAYERKFLMKKIREKETRNLQLKDEKIRQGEEYEGIRQKFINLASSEQEIIGKVIKEQHFQEYECKEHEEYEKEKLEYKRIEGQVKDEMIIKELNEKYLEIELYGKILKDEKLKLDCMKESLTREQQELQSEKLVFYEEMMEEREKIEEYFTDIALKTSILNNKKEKQNL
ncbi:hypothetical protein SteCoe_35099 [Stentor coeruleus]|uniref:Uncharacterized protein n=1 Tax=Stentor coeruleus TaxID=5963 RepID=A0A1R2AT27_9CILI|nr:hypothetical protein SteCoe_35099 [Stentor coeruleus]